MGNVSCVSVNKTYDGMLPSYGTFKLEPGCSFAMLSTVLFVNAVFNVNMSTFLPSSATTAPVNMTMINTTFVNSTMNIISDSAAAHPVDIFISGCLFDMSRIFLNGSLLAYSSSNVTIRSSSFTEKGTMHGIFLNNWKICNKSIFSVSDSSVQFSGPEAALVQIQQGSTVAVCAMSQLIIQNMSGMYGTLMNISNSSSLIVRDESFLSFASCSLTLDGSILNVHDSSTFIVANSSSLSISKSQTTLFFFFGSFHPPVVFTLNSTLMVINQSVFSLSDTIFKSVGVALFVNQSTIYFSSNSALSVSNISGQSGVAALLSDSSNITVINGSTVVFRDGVFSYTLPDLVLLHNSSLIVALASSFAVLNCSLVTASAKYPSVMSGTAISSIVVRDRSRLTISNVTGQSGTVFSISDNSFLFVISSTVVLAMCEMSVYGSAFGVENSSVVTVADNSNFSLSRCSVTFHPDSGNWLRKPPVGFALNSTLAVFNGSVLTVSGIVFLSVGVGLCVNQSAIYLSLNSSLSFLNISGQSGVAAFLIDRSNVTITHGSIFVLRDATFSSYVPDFILVRSSVLSLSIGSAFSLVNSSLIVSSTLSPIIMTGIAFRTSAIILSDASMVSFTGIALPSSLGMSCVLALDTSSLSASHSSGLEIANANWTTREIHSISLILVKSCNVFLQVASFWRVQNVTLVVANKTHADGGCVSVVSSAWKIMNGSIWIITSTRVNGGAKFSAVSFQRTEFDVSTSSKWSINNAFLRGCETGADSPPFLHMQFVSIKVRDSSVFSLLAGATFYTSQLAGYGLNCEAVDITDSDIVIVERSQWQLVNSNMSSLTFFLGTNLSVTVTKSSSFILANVSDIALQTDSFSIAVMSSSDLTLRNITALYFLGYTANVSISNNSSWIMSLVVVETQQDVYDNPAWSQDNLSSFSISSFSTWRIEESRFAAQTSLCESSLQLDCAISILMDSAWIINRSVINGSACSTAGLRVTGSVFVNNRSAWIVNAVTAVGSLSSLQLDGGLSFSNESWFGILSNTFITKTPATVGTSTCCSFSNLYWADNSPYISYTNNSCTADSAFPLFHTRNWTFLYRCNLLNGAPQLTGYPSQARSVGSCAPPCSSESDCYKFLAQSCTYKTREASCSCSSGGAAPLCLPTTTDSSPSPQANTSVATVTHTLTSTESVDDAAETVTSSDSVTAKLSLSRSATESSCTPEDRGTESLSLFSNSENTVVASATVTPPVLIQQGVKVIASAPARQAAAVAVAASTLAASVAGPSGASDVQAVAVLLLAPCVGAGKGKRSGYSALSPVALSDSPGGVLGGNAIACLAVFATQLVLVVLLRPMKSVDFIAASVRLRFPALALTTTASLFQGTLVTSLALLSAGDSPLSILGGAAGIAWSCALPCTVAIAVRKFPRRFVAYIYENRSSRFFRFRMVLPVGVVLPKAARRMASSLVCGVSKPHVLYALAPFLSPVTLGLVSLVPESATPAACNALLWVSGAMHLATAVAVVGFRVHRALPTRLLTAAGLCLTTLGHALVATNAPSSSTDS